MTITELEAENKELKATNRELQEQLEQMRSIFDSLSEGVVATSIAGEFWLANPTAVGIVGMGPTDEPTDEWSEHYGTFHADQITPVPNDELPLMKAMQGEITDNVELFIRNEARPKGVFIDVSGRPLHNASGELIGGVILLRDTSELRAVQEQLDNTLSIHQNQSQLLDTIFNNISDAVIVADANGKYTLCNKRAEEMGGNEMLGTHIKDAPRHIGLFRPDGDSYFPADELPIIQALQGEKTDNIEMLLRNEEMPQGIHVSVSGRPIVDEQGFVTSAVSVAHDITRIKQTEDRLRNTITKLEQQTQLLESVFDNMSDGIVVADKDGELTMYNPRADQIAGGLKPDVPIPDWTEKYGMFYMDGETEFPTNELPLVRAIRGEPTDHVEIFVRNPAIPEGAYLSVSGRPLRDENGKQQGGVVVFHDMTDKVRAAEHLTMAFTQGRLEVVDTVLHNIGNAINSVAVGVNTVYEQLSKDDLSLRLTALANALEAHRENLGEYITNHPQGQKVLPFVLALASDLIEADNDLKETIERVREKTSHIVDIVRTQESHGNTGDTRKDINLVKSLSSAIRVLHDSIEKRGIQIEIDCDDAIGEIRIQESQFHQMIVNLVKNSIEAIDDLEKLEKPSEAPSIRVRAHREADNLYIDVTDNGIGIDAEQSKAIFSAGYTTKQKGTGLGLHSSANFVIASGGKISASSDGHRKGATMHIVLPCSKVFPNYHSNERTETDGQS